jgi:Baseplate J-like protein
MPVATSSAGAAAPVAAVTVSEDARRPARTPAAIPAARVVADTPATPTGERDVPRPTRTEPAGRRLLPSIGRTPLLIGLALLALAVIVVGGAGAFLFLPTAKATITPREATVGPTSLRIQASTSASEPDPERLIVPARLLTIPLEANDTFPATGKRIEEEKAHGSVRFDNLDPTSSNGIPKGSIVSTDSGVRFRTDKAVTVPPAELVGLTIVPSHASVDVTAVDAGPEGNVEPNAIRTVPRGEEPFFLKVTNPEATSGGKRTEFPRVTQDDVDKATAALTDQLDAAFEERLDDPNLPGDEATVFPETKTLGAPVFGVEPGTLVGQEVETFDLSATNSGTVVAVDTSPVQAVAEANIDSSVTPGYVLVEGSGHVDPAPAEISDGVITFPVVVTAREVLVLDPDAIEREIMGKPLDQAREILATYGDADLKVWPDWVGTVPTIESRVEVTAANPETSPESSP